MEQNKPIVVITGANRGIGLALTKEYLSFGYHVVAACRQASVELKATDAQVVENVDVADAASLQAVIDSLIGKSIDILINNAGIWRTETFEDLNLDTMREQFDVNALAPLKVTQVLTPYLSAKAKVGLITSRMGSIADNGSGGRYGYRMSKAALNAGGKSLALDLKPKGIAIAILHPGFVQTDMVNFAGDITAQECAQRLKVRMDELNINNTGTFWHSNGEVLPW